MGGVTKGEAKRAETNATLWIPCSIEKEESLSITSGDIRASERLRAFQLQGLPDRK
jgi:hypothetical protein